MASTLTSMRDAAQVARFHVVKAVRTRTLMFMVSIYVIAAAGIAWIFRGIIHELEKNAAGVLRVPVTDTPGAMIDTLREQGDLADTLRALVPEPGLLDWALELPILTVSHFWMALGTLPFLAAAAGAEIISPAIKDRSLRFELVRTGRLELVMGRWGGQAILMMFATLMSILGPWVIGVFFMANQPPLDQASTLLMVTPRLIAWSLPFLGLGVACSQLTANTNGARTLALGSVVGTWILWGTLKTDWLSDHVPILADILSPLMPQNYVVGLWGAGNGWMISATILTGLGLAFMLAVFPFFQKRNL